LRQPEVAKCFWCFIDFLKFFDFVNGRLCASAKRFQLYGSSRIIFLVLRSSGFTSAADAKKIIPCRDPFEDDNFSFFSAAAAAASLSKELSQELIKKSQFASRPEKVAQFPLRAPVVI
jgi:hypothetical protein